MKITELFVRTGLAKSNKDAKRLIQEGGARVEGVVIDDPNLIVAQINGVLLIGRWVGDKFELIDGLPGVRV